MSLKKKRVHPKRKRDREKNKMLNQCIENKRCTNIINLFKIIVPPVLIIKRFFLGVN